MKSEVVESAGVRCYFKEFFDKVLISSPILRRRGEASSVVAFRSLLARPSIPVGRIGCLLIRAVSQSINLLIKP